MHVCIHVLVVCMCVYVCTVCEYVHVCIWFFFLCLLNKINKKHEAVLSSYNISKHLPSCLSDMIQLRSYCLGMRCVIAWHKLLLQFVWRDIQSISQFIHFSFYKWHRIFKCRWLNCCFRFSCTDAIWVFIACLSHQCACRDRKLFLWLFQELPVRLEKMKKNKTNSVFQPPEKSWTGSIGSALN